MLRWKPPKNHNFGCNKLIFFPQEKASKPNNSKSPENFIKLSEERVDKNFTKQEEEADAKCKKKWHMSENLMREREREPNQETKQITQAQKIPAATLHLKSWKIQSLN